LGVSSLGLITLTVLQKPYYRVRLDPIFGEGIEQGKEIISVELSLHDKDASPLSNGLSLWWI
jgi:hypothetical protein